jgi:phage terminase small subunit
MAKKPTHLKIVGKEQSLTGKQEAFAKLVAGGAVLSDAYRECYSADTMKDSTVWSEACRLAQNPKVSARIKDIQADMEADRRTIEARRSEWILKRLTEEADQADNASSRIRALELLGKSLTVSMFTDRIEQAGTAERSASEIEKDLKARLDRLIGS